MNSQIDKIYLYLLNRKPLEKERADLLGKSFSDINRKIINSVEYQNFMEINYKLIKSIVKQIWKLDVINEIEPMIWNEYYDYLRNHKYSQLEFKKYILEHKKKFLTRIQDIFKDIYVRLDNSRVLDNQKINFINSRFVLKHTNLEIEKNIIWCDSFYNFCERELVLL